jgi:mannitol/fructose-specific phosphotransferase system IIA component (Ntr-type)
MVKLLSYLSEDDILEFPHFNEKKVNKALIEHCLKGFDKEFHKKAFGMLKLKKNGKNLNLTRGFALTHIRLDAVDDIKIAIGIIDEREKKLRINPIKALFCVVIPEDKCQAYLSLMAHISRLLSEKEAGEVFRPGNKKGIIEFIRQFEEN